MSGKFNQAEYIRNFNKENYECISLRVKKGYKKKFKALAKNKGMSMAEFIINLVDESEGKPL